MRKIALLIGVSEFDSGDLDPLPKALADIKAIEEVLLDPELGGFEESHVTVLKNPKRLSMEDAIYDIFNKQKSKRDDLLLFYFSGHGIVDESGIFYFSTRETRKDNGKLRPTTAVESNYIHKYLNQCRSRRITIILDCCHSGAFAQGLTHKGAANLQIKEQLGGEGRAILTAASMTQYAWSKDEYPLSAYTHFLLEGVKTGEADTDRNQYLSMEEIHEYAKKKVLESGLEMTPEFYPVREGAKIRLFKRKINPKEEYRKEIEQFIPEGNIPEYMKYLLVSRREELGLSEEEAREIENQVFAEVIQKQKNIEIYRKAVQKAFPEGSDLNNSSIWNNLKKYQIHFQLKDEDVGSIHQEVRGRLENSEQKRKQQEEEEKRRLEVEAKRQYQANLEQYKINFQTAIESNYPLEKTIEEKLKQQQLQWKLKAEDVAEIEKPFREQAEKEYKVKLREEELRKQEAVGYDYTKLENYLKNGQKLRKEELRKQEAVGYDYTKLENYLKNGQWKEADQETTKIMLEIGDKDKKKYLTIDDIKKFPVEDLRTIDQLWLKYSNNKFGFSVQKQIWLNCGGKLDYSYQWDIYEKFGNRVGWRKRVKLLKKEWKSYNELNFSTNAPQGHLPDDCVGESAGVGGYSFLLSKL
ncbi:MAG: hypothetical protein F6K10_40960 [Moorea sp. SIO2B7]|nr:hypothetical protein [Moorena sp. SIO2B7]